MSLLYRPSPSQPEVQYLPLPAKPLFLPNHYFFTSYPSRAEILTAFHIAKGRAQLLRLCVQDQGAPPILASSLCPSPRPTELVPPSCCKPLPKLCHMLSCPATPSRKTCQVDPIQATGLPGSLRPCHSSHSLHLLVTTFVCSFSPGTPHSWHIHVMLGKHTAMYGVSLPLWFVSSRDVSCLGP